MVKVGYLYLKGLKGVEKDEEKAFQFFMKAAKKDYPIGMYNASGCLMEGIGCTKNAQKAFKLMEKAVKNNLEKAVPDYGCMIKDGFGTEKKWHI